MIFRFIREKIKACSFGDAFLCLSVIMIMLFIIRSMISPCSQNNLVFRGGADFLGDHINHVKYTFSRNIYTAEGSAVLNHPMIPGLSLEGERLDRLFPPLAYLMLSVPKSMTAMNNARAPMFLVTALWSVVCWSCMLLLICYTQFRGPAWKKSVFTFTVLFSGVMLYAAERGTLVLLSSSLTAFFIFNYRHPDRRIRETALIALALAAGLKLSPACMGLLPVIEKRWKEAARLILYGIAAFFLPFFFLPGGLKNIPRLWENILANGNFYLSAGHHVGVGSRLPEMLCGFSGAAVSVASITSVLYFLCIAAALLGVILAFFEKEHCRKIFFMLLPVLFVPRDSGYYNLLYLLPVIILLCNDERKLNLTAVIILVLLVSLFMPFQIFHNHYQRNWLAAPAVHLLSLAFIVSALKDFIGGIRRRGQAF